MISTNNDLYNAVRAISNKLKINGEIELSNFLIKALSISGLPGEILGESRYRLQKLRDLKITKILSLEDQINEALVYLNAIL